MTPQPPVRHVLERIADAYSDRSHPAAHLLEEIDLGADRRWGLGSLGTFEHERWLAFMPVRNVGSLQRQIERSDFSGYVQLESGLVVHESVAALTGVDGKIYNPEGPIRIITKGPRIASPAYGNGISRDTGIFDHLR